MFGFPHRALSLHRSIRFLNREVESGVSESPDQIGASRMRFRMCERWMRLWTGVALAICLVGSDLGAEESAVLPLPEPAPFSELSSAEETGTRDPQLPATVVSQSVFAAAPSPPTRAPAVTAAPPQPWKILYFDNDFRYKQNPNHVPLFGENLKDVPLEGLFESESLEQTTLSFGGELRWRWMDEVNRLRPPFLVPERSVYDLVRWRNYLDLKHSDWIRLYVETIHADIYNYDLPVTGIDSNRWDLQNAFVDIKVLERDDKPVWLRVGRQELLFGTQRLVSPLDWANTRRNFQGLRLTSPGTDWDLDAWLTHPVNTATVGSGGGVGPSAGVNRFDSQFDTVNRNVTFGGFYASYKAIKNHTIDAYLLWSYYDEAFVGGDGYPVGNRFLPALRWAGTFPVSDGARSWLTDVEGGYQCGNDRSESVQAGFVAAGLGHQWKRLPWEPTLWMYYDYATGDGNPDDDVNNTFFQYYGLVHAYMGLIDNLARQNLSDVNWRLQLRPTPRLTLQVAQHFFQLANTNDRLYTVGGQPFPAPTNRGSQIGSELDLLATWNVCPNVSLEMGYFQFFYGDYIETVSPRGNAELLYLQTTLRY